MPAISDATLRGIGAGSGYAAELYPVALIVIRGKRRWWRRYPDLFAIVAPDQIHRFPGNSIPTREAPPGSRFPTYTLPPGECLVGFGYDPHRRPSEVLRQTHPLRATTTTGKEIEGFIQFMVHAGPGSFGCYTIPPARWQEFHATLRSLAVRHGNPPGHTDAGLYSPHTISKVPLVPLITRPA